MKRVKSRKLEHTPKEVPVPPDPECHGESYRDIRNRAPTVIKTWQELVEGYADHPEHEEDPRPE